MRCWKWSLIVVLLAVAVKRLIFPGKLSRWTFFMDSEFAGKFPYPSNAIITSTVPKMGQTATINMLLALATANGDPKKMEHICARPIRYAFWPELVYRPGFSEEEMIRAGENPATDPMIVKSHVLPPELPLNSSLKYITIFRHPMDAAVSSFYFNQNFNFEEISNTWLVMKLMSKLLPAPGEMSFADYLAFGQHTKSSHDAAWMPPWAPSYGESLSNWWKHRHDPNVLILHFSEIKGDKRALLQKLVKFTGIPEPQDEEAWGRVLKYSSFEWMRDNIDMGDPEVWPELVSAPLLARGNPMFRKGQIRNKEDQLLWTEELKQDFYARLREDLNEEQIAWMENGGPLPN